MACVLNYELLKMNPDLKISAKKEVGPVSGIATCNRITKEITRNF